jgi:hypothetical protein
MTDNNQQPRRTIRRKLDRQNLENDVFDRELDTALEKYAAAEPRTGLEERVLANLQTEQNRAPMPAWWLWAAVTALAVVMLVVTASLAWRFERPVPAAMAQPTLAPTQSNQRVGVQVASNSGRGLHRLQGAGSMRRLNPHALSHTAAAAVPVPKLDQFPSPQPLNQQEEMLAEYAIQHRQQAILIARDRMAELKQDWPQADSSLLTSDSSTMQQENR